MTRSSTSQDDAEPDITSYRLAWKAFRDGAIISALSYIEQAIESSRSPHMLTTYWATKGGFLNRCGFHNEAILACKQAIELEERNPWAWSQLGLAELRLDKFQEAAIALRKAASLRPDQYVYTLLARAELEVDSARAIETARKALEIDPMWHEALEIIKAASQRPGSSNQKGCDR